MNINFLKQKFIDSIGTQKKVAGIEIQQDDKGFLFHVVVLEKEKGEISLIENRENIQEIVEVAKLVGEDIPAYLALNIRGVLHKHTNVAGSAKQQMQAVLPNVNPEEFYWQSESVGGGYAISLARKKVLDETLSVFSQNKIWVTGLNLGSFHLRYIAPLLDLKNTVSASGFQFHFDENARLLSYAKTEVARSKDMVKIGEDELEQALLPAYAAAFKGLVHGRDNLGVAVVLANQQEFFHKQLFQKASIAILMGLMLVLLANTFFYYHFKSNNTEAKTILSRKRHELSLLDSLKTQARQQEKLQLQTNINRSSKASFYADRIGASIPEGIQLQELEIFPLQGKAADYKEGELWQYQRNKINIKGQCKNSLIYNEWLQTLKGLDWVATAKHLTYKETNPRLKEFEMSILIAEP